MAKQADLRRLRKTLCDFFDEEELRTICFDLGYDYDSLGGTTKDGKARELVGRCSKNGRTLDLLKAVYNVRPNAFWLAAHDAAEQSLFSQALLSRLGVDVAMHPGLDIPIIPPKPTSKTGPLRDDYRALLRLSLDRLHERLDQQGETIGRLRVFVSVALMLAGFTAVVQVVTLLVVTIK